jgi:hypothetical protein
VKNLVKRYEKLPYKAFPTPARRKDAPPEIPVVSWEDRAFLAQKAARFRWCARCRTEGEGAAIELRNPP